MHSARRHSSPRLGPRVVVPLFRGRLQQIRDPAGPSGLLNQQQHPFPLQFATGRVWSVEAVKAPVADVA